MWYNFIQNCRKIAGKTILYNCRKNILKLVKLAIFYPAAATMFTEIIVFISNAIYRLQLLDLFIVTRVCSRRSIWAVYKSTVWIETRWLVTRTIGITGHLVLPAGTSCNLSLHLQWQHVIFRYSGGIAFQVVMNGM